MTSKYPWYPSTIHLSKYTKKIGIQDIQVSRYQKKVVSTHPYITSKRNILDFSTIFMFCKHRPVIKLSQWTWHFFLVAICSTSQCAYELEYFQGACQWVKPSCASFFGLFQTILGWSRARPKIELQIGPVQNSWL